MSETLCLEWVDADQPQSNSFVIDGDTVSFSIEKWNNAPQPWFFGIMELWMNY